MIKNIIRPLALLRKINTAFNSQTSCFFSTPSKVYYYKKKQNKQEGSGSIVIKNDNLRFDTEGFSLFFYPFHPEVIKKNASLYEINKFSVVAALSFIPKSNPGIVQTPESNRQSWENRRSIAMRFNELTKLLEVNPNEEGQWTTEVNRDSDAKSSSKILTLINSKKSNAYDVTLEEKFGKMSQWKINTKITHSEFSLFQFLLKQSLYDLSGMKLVFDLRRNEELAKMTTKDKGDIDRESLFKSYETKDDVV